MRCDEFADRMNHVLDLRQDAAADGKLLSHASRCGACRGSLGQWADIQANMFSSQAADDRPTFIVSRNVPRVVQVGGPWLAIAAAVAWFFLSFNQPVKEVQQGLGAIAVVEASSEIAAAEFDFQLLGRQVREPGWWGGIAVAPLKPVEQIATGIRPVTNSFQSAINILTPRSAPPADQTRDEASDFSASHVEILLSAA